jgi:hypothetical protein
MYVMPQEGDTPEILALKAAIDREWKRTLRLRKAMVASQEQEGLHRARLRLLVENLNEGEKLYIGYTNQVGTLELSGDMPYLWLRALDKSGKPTKRRFKFDEGHPVRRPKQSEAATGQ